MATQEKRPTRLQAKSSVLPANITCSPSAVCEVADADVRRSTVTNDFELKPVNIEVEVGRIPVPL